MQDEILPPLVLSSHFKSELSRIVPYPRVIKALYEGQNGEDPQAEENHLHIPTEVAIPAFPMEEIIQFAVRRGWPHQTITLYLARAEMEMGARSGFLSQCTIYPPRGMRQPSYYQPPNAYQTPQHPYQPPPHGAPQTPPQAGTAPPAGNPDPLAGLSEMQRLTMEVTKLAAMAAGGGKRASVLDRFLSGEIGPDEAMGWLIKAQRLLPAVKNLITVGIKWVVPLVRETWEESKTKAEQDKAKATKKPDAARSPEAAPPP